MSECEPITYKGITPTVFNNLKAMLGKVGLNVPSGNEGEIEGYGVKGHYLWDGATTLTLVVTDKPFVLPCAIIVGKLNDAIRDCGGSV